jgi:peptide/nickel transport system permease protein
MPCLTRESGTHNDHQAIRGSNRERSRGVKDVNQSDSRDTLVGQSEEKTDAVQRQVTLANQGAQGTVMPRTSVWKRFRRHTLAVIGLITITILAVLSFGAPILAQNSPNATDLMSISQAPSSDYWLGTDATGRDVFSRLLYAGRISLSVGIAVVVISLIIGLTLGAISGYFGGFTDASIMRFVDVVLSFPSVLIIITLISMLGPSLFNLILVMGLLNWPPITRLLRAEFLSLRERDYVLAARSIGANGTQLVVRHMLPNAMAPIIVAATFGVASAILLEAGLSFLGLGVQVPTPSWGNMLTAAQSLSVLDSMPWLWIPPGIMIALAVLAINFIGDGLRDALDPRMRSR